MCNYSCGTVFQASQTHLFLIHRMLLLESLQSKLMRYKLLEHLLDYACPQKISVPMSLSLLLHFLKNCTLAPDPTVNINHVSFYVKADLLTDALPLRYNFDFGLDRDNLILRDDFLLKNIFQGNTFNVLLRKTDN